MKEDILEVSLLFTGFSDMQFSSVPNSTRFPPVIRNIVYNGDKLPVFVLYLINLISCQVYYQEYAERITMEDVMSNCLAFG